MGKETPHGTGYLPRGTLPGFFTRLGLFTVIGNTKVMTLQAPWERKLPKEPGIYLAVLYPGIYPLKFVYRTGRQVQRVLRGNFIDSSLDVFNHGN